MTPEPSPPFSSEPSLPVLIVGGPTGSGKSRLAVAVAQTWDSVIINADSMQLYRELQVLTARPSAEDEAAVPHRLFGVLSLETPGSVASWLDLAEREIRCAWAAGRLPIVVGGTGLYLKALTEGLATIPPIPAAFRAEASQRYAELGGAAFRERLAVLDPETAARVPAGDRQRLIRADEVVRATGRTLAEWCRGTHSPALTAQFATVLLLPPRDRLYAAIEARFDAMLAAGALAEVAPLTQMSVDLPGMKALGVRPLLAYLRGELGLDAACALAKRDSRRYAKRQLTWLRHQIPNPGMILEQYSERVQPKLFAFVRDFLLTRSH